MADPATLVSNPDLVTAATKLVEFTSHVTAALVATQGIQIAKQAPWLKGFTEASSTGLKRTINVVVALAMSLGITITFTQIPVQDAPGHLRYMIDLTGLASVSIWSHLWHFIEELAMQQGFYTGAVKPKEVIGPHQPAPPVPVVPVAAGGQP